MEETHPEDPKNGEGPVPSPSPPEDEEGSPAEKGKREGQENPDTGAPGVTVLTHTAPRIERPPAAGTRQETETLPGTRPPPTRPETVLAGPDLETAKTLAPYRVLGEIGRGGMGVVYKAYDDKLKRTVALKVLIAGEDASEEAIARFHREAESVARLGHHPNIVPIYEIGREGRLQYFAMLYVDGKPLDKMIFDGEVAPKRAAVFTKRVAEALDHAHAHGVLHRDVKPANILVSKDGEPHLTDFGLAKNVESDTRMTRSGVTLGTPQYMPPEQAEGRLSEVDARSDVYSLGATLYEMLTGEPPFHGEIVINVIKRMLTEDAISPRRTNPGISRDIETICLKCLEKDPNRRYASAMALAEDIARMLEGRPILARPISRLSRLWRRARRNKAAAIGIAGMVLLAIALGLFTLGPGGVTVRSEPPGAKVLLDGRETGWRTPVEGRILWPPGTYRIALVSEGFDRAEGEVRVSPLSTGEAAFSLVKDHGFVKIAVRPAEAAVTFLVGARRVEGASYQCKPDALPETERGNPAPPPKEREKPFSFRCYRLPKGAHGLEMVSGDFETRREVLFVTPDHVQTVIRDLPRRKGRLMVLSNVKDVSMKAYRKGTSRLKPLVFSIPWRDIPLDAGTWNLEFEKEGYWKSYRIVTIKGGKRPVVVHTHMRKKR